MFNEIRVDIPAGPGSHITVTSSVSLSHYRYGPGRAIEIGSNIIG